VDRATTPRLPIRCAEYLGGKELGTSTFTGTIGVAWAPGDALLAAVGGGKHVAVWRVSSWGAPAATWEVGSDYQSAVAFHPTRPVLAVASHDGHVRIYGVAGGQLAKPPLLIDKDVAAISAASRSAPTAPGCGSRRARPRARCSGSASSPRLRGFGEQVNDYADLYTSQVSNFGPYSPLRYFRAPRRPMPHEI
jgi:hypothetical protein